MKSRNLFSGIAIFEAFRTQKAETPFVVINSDKRNGLYVKKLARLMADYDLTAKYGDDDIAQVGTYDAIVFDDQRSFDYYFVPAAELLSSSDKYPVAYDLISDFKKIEWHLKQLFDNNKSKVTSSMVDRAIVVAARQVPQKPVVTFQPCPSFACGIVTFADEEPIREVQAEKITVFDNFVKIGFNKFDIYVDLFGNEFIVHPTEGRLFVKTDRRGRKYLTA